tara:strand:+ start:138 stop:398 length:261 start_codon:yes stop_codon:yes gene_type:complete
LNTVNEAFETAQGALAALKAAVRTVLECAPEEGLRNVDVGKSLGIYGGHVEHVGHISRTILAMLESDGIAEQFGPDKRWRLVNHIR